jgi:putative ABC transport system substrate-binding protein
MRRREFIGLIGAAAVGIARPALGQKIDVPLVGFLLPTTESIAKQRITALREGLQEAGFIEGTNYSLATRFAHGDFDRVPSLVKELAALNPRVMVVGAMAFKLRIHSFPEFRWSLPAFRSTRPNTGTPTALRGRAEW